MTGIAGLTLGGGLGWLNGRYGLACDNLISADVATADGQLLRSARSRTPTCSGAFAAAAATSESLHRSSINSIRSTLSWPAACRSH